MKVQTVTTYILELGTFTITLDEPVYSAFDYVAQVYPTTVEELFKAAVVLKQKGIESVNHLSFDELCIPMTLTEFLALNNLTLSLYHLNLHEYIVSRTTYLT